MVSYEEVDIDHKLTLRRLAPGRLGVAAQVASLPMSLPERAHEL